MPAVNHQLRQCLTRTMEDYEAIVFGVAPPEITCRQRPAAYAVINDAAGNVAVVRGGQKQKHFWLPGGGIQRAESPEQAIVREVDEELGRQVALHRQIGEAIQFFYASDDECWYRMHAHFFAAQLGGETKRHPEHELQWVDPVRNKSSFFHECHVWAIGQESGRRSATSINDEKQSS